MIVAFMLQAGPVAGGVPAGFAAHVGTAAQRSNAIEHSHFFDTATSL